jgi:2-polyprenyl-3-methyl-5-hydroxy-6-metoxy-1,4-benzoquinol methylase
MLTGGPISHISSGNSGKLRGNVAPHRASARHSALDLALRNGSFLIVIGTLLKQLVKGLGDYAKYHVKRLFGGRVPADAADAPAFYTPAAKFDWQVLSDPGSQVYVGGPAPSTLDLLVQEPKFVLDVGCGAGDFAVQLKQRFPGARVWGVEPGKDAARFAAKRLDRVLPVMIEKIDWNREGVKRGDIDTVLLMDVLEHIYDPWTTLLTLRNLVSEKAQLLVSIPNVRNALLIQDLAAGYWRYRRAGLLDITHIRFFTLNDMYRMFYQTGFRVLRTGATQCTGSAQILNQNRDGIFPKKIALGSASITVDSPEDLDNLCALQHLFTLQPANYEELSPRERAYIDAPHPPTLAYSPD